MSSPHLLPRAPKLGTHVALAWGLFLTGIVVGAPPAQALRDERESRPGMIAFGDLTPVSLTTQIPVGWQMSRSRLTEDSSSIVSETYREMWTLEVQTSGLMNLANTRGRVAIFPAEPAPFSPMNTNMTIPAIFVIGDQDLARLVGIPLDPEETSVEEGEYPPHDIQRPIVVNLVRPSRTGIDLSITWTEDIHYEVHLDFGGSPGI